MKKNLFTEDRELFDGNDTAGTERIIDLITPKFAPEARFEFRPAEKRRRMFCLHRAIRPIAVAAVVAIGVFLGLNGIGNARAAENEEIVERALADLSASESYRIKFTASVKEHRKSGNTEIYKITPAGEPVGATIEASRSDGAIAARIEWNDAKHSTQIFENGTYRLLENGEVKEEFQSTSPFDKILQLLDFERVKNIFQDNDIAIKVKDNGDLIEMTVLKRSKEKYPAETMTAVFSKSKGRLLKAKVDCDVDGTRTTLLDITEIEYGF